VPNGRRSDRVGSARDRWLETDNVGLARETGARGPGDYWRRSGGRVEFLNLVIIFVTALLVLRKPERERLAVALFVTSILLMIGVFLLATRTSILPGVNY
jgi:hypothetical protein